MEDKKPRVPPPPSNCKVVVRDRTFNLSKTELLSDSPNYFTSKFFEGGSYDPVTGIHVDRSPRSFKFVRLHLTGADIFPPLLDAMKGPEGATLFYDLQKDAEILGLEKLKVKLKSYRFPDWQLGILGIGSKVVELSQFYLHAVSIVRQVQAGHSGLLILVRNCKLTFRESYPVRPPRAWDVSSPFNRVALIDFRALDPYTFSLPSTDGARYGFSPDASIIREDSDSLTAEVSIDGKKGTLETLFKEGIEAGSSPPGPWTVEELSVTQDPTPELLRTARLLPTAVTRSVNLMAHQVFLTPTFDAINFCVKFNYEYAECSSTSGVRSNVFETLRYVQRF